MIEVENLHKAYGSVTAAAGISLTARDGAITTLLGGNGSGKTTTLRAIAGLIRPDLGSACVDGVDARRDRIGALRHLGVFADRFGLYPRLTAREHLGLAGGLHGLSGRTLAAAIDETIERLDMASIADRRTAGMSQGQQVKVALGRAIVHRPRNLILDEPTRGLDIFAVRLLRGLLKQLRNEGLCILMSSHVMAEVAELSNSVTLVADGCTAASGTPADIMRIGGNSDDLEAAVMALTGANTQKKRNAA